MFALQSATGRPSLRLTRVDDDFLVDVQTLGEYGTPVTAVTLSRGPRWCGRSRRKSLCHCSCSSFTSDPIQAISLPVKEADRLTVSHARERSQRLSTPQQCPRVGRSSSRVGRGIGSTFGETSAGGREPRLSSCLETAYVSAPPRHEGIGVDWRALAERRETAVAPGVATTWCAPPPR